MSSGGSLLEVVQGLLERTYRMDTGVSDVGRFVIGDSGLGLLYGTRTVVTGIGSAAAPGAKTLVRETEQGIRACIYFPDELIRNLEQHPPQRRLQDSNVDAFATLVEELDHFLCIAERCRQERPVSLFELELHANVSKHLVVSRFLAGAGRKLSSGERAWVRFHLFDKGTYRDDDPSVQQRYHEAARWAVRFLAALDGRSPAERIDALRRFHDASARGKLRWIRRLAA